MKLDLTGYTVRKSTKEARKGEIIAISSTDPHARDFRARYTLHGRRFWLVYTRVKPAHNQWSHHWRETVAGKDTERQLEAFVAKSEVKP